MPPNLRDLIFWTAALTITAALYLTMGLLRYSAPH
jgi:hypothetical protein